MYDYFKSQEFRLKDIDKARNFFLEEIKQNELMSKKHKNVCTTLSFVEHFPSVNFLQLLDLFKFLLLLLCLVFL